MAEKKLLNVTFKASPEAEYSINIGCNSSDNINYTEPATLWYDSKNTRLNQTGCLIFIPNVNVPETNDIRQSNLYVSLSKTAGYGPRVNLCPAFLFKNTPFYLNGNAFDVDGNPQPYVQWENGVGGADHPVLIYYKADGTRVGDVYTYYLGTYFGSNITWVAGKLYDDGTFTGSAGAIRPKNLAPGVWSQKYYEWRCNNNSGDEHKIYENAPLINENVINDLLEYLPIEPEGDFMDPGEGNFDGTSDAISFPGLPSISALDTGMCAMYEMSSAQLRALSGYLWSTDFFDTIKKMFNDPMESILNLAIMPIEYYNLIPATIKIGNELTTVSGNMLTTPYKIIDFGTINLLEYWGSFADYSPYTKLSIFLPYVGVQNISIDDVMNGAIQLKAYCDCLTGSIQYMLYSVQNNHRGHNHASVLYTWGGNMQYQIPLTASNFSSVVSSLIGAGSTIAGGIGTAIATGGVTAPIAIGTATGAISNVMNAKTHVQRGGGIGGAVGLFGVQTPYLILERPEEIYPENYEHTVGVPNPVTDYLKNYEGFVKVNGVHLEIPNATENELNDIQRMLKDGVIV